MEWLSIHIATFFTALFVSVVAVFGFHASEISVPAPTSTASVVTAISQPGPAPITPSPIFGLRINSISPQEGPVGTKVTLTGSGFTSNNVVFFDAGAISSVISTNKVTLSFVIPQSLGPYCAPGMACPMYMLLVTPRTYTIHVQNAGGSTNSVSFTVTGTNPISEPSSSYQMLQVPGSVTLSKNGSALVESGGSVLGYVTLESTEVMANGIYEANLSIAPNAPSAACSASGAICNLPMELAISIPQNTIQNVDGMKITASSVHSGTATLVFAVSAQ